LDERLDVLQAGHTP